MRPFYQAKNGKFTLFHGDSRELIENIGRNVDMILLTLLISCQEISQHTEQENAQLTKRAQILL